jgi:DNA-binding NarL/FixJ family response regulator
MLKILICDDHQLYREGLYQLARQLDDDVKVVHAGTYPETMSAIAAGDNFDLILADLKMPLMGEMAGVAAINRETQDTPVVVVSAFESPQNVKDAMAAGSAGFLPKSSPIKVMLDALRQVLAGGTYFPESLIDGAPTVSLAAARAANNSQSETARARLDLLTHRQRDVLALVGEGRSNKDIADTLGISEGTVKVHVSAILKALGTTNRTQAALIAIDFGIAQPHHDAGTASRA